MPTESRIRVAQALHSVFGQGSRIPDTWDGDLSSEDAVFAQAVLGLCLRRWGRLQSFIRTKLADPERGVPLGTQICLAIGFAQLAWLPGVSDHAAVHEAVDLVNSRTHGFPPHKGLVNALLRTGAKDRAGLQAELNALPSSLDRTAFADRVLAEALAPRHQEPHLEELWARLQEPPRPSFRAVKKGPIPDGLEADPELPGALRMTPDATFPRQWLTSGAGMVQDRSSQALMNFYWDRPVSRIADLCAAPGGKTTSLALRWPEAELYAVEQHPRRARRLEENLHTRGINAHLIVAEAATWMEQTDLTFDLILIDAPCSGSGTIRKHPELVWLGGGLEEATLWKTQQSLLHAAIPRLAKGGLLIYSVCSWLPEEGRNLRKTVLNQHEELESTRVWPDDLGSGLLPDLFLPNPLKWDGEGFQAFTLIHKQDAVLAE